MIEARIAQLAPADRRGARFGLGDGIDNLALMCAPPLGAAVIAASPHLVGIVPRSRSPWASPSRSSIAPEEMSAVVAK